MTIFDYSTVEWCRNPDTWDGLCMKCEECGRKFDEHGVMINEEVQDEQIHLDEKSSKKYDSNIARQN